MTLCEGAGDGMLDNALAKARARLLDPAKAQRQVEPAVFSGLTNPPGSDAISLSMIER